VLVRLFNVFESLLFFPRTHLIDTVKKQMNLMEFLLIFQQPIFQSSVLHDPSEIMMLFLVIFFPFLHHHYAFLFYFVFVIAKKKKKNLKNSSLNYVLKMKTDGWLGVT